MTAGTPGADATAARRRRGWFLEFEDLALFAYLVIGERVVMHGITRVAGDVNPLNPLGGTHGLAAAVASFGAALGAAACLATRSRVAGPDDPVLRDSFETYARIVSMVLVGMLVMAGQAALGRDMSLGPFCGVLGALTLAHLLYARLPRVPTLVRRVLMTPAILLGTSAFTTFARRMLPGRAQVVALWRPHGSGHAAATLVTELLLGAVATYYILFVFAPRKAAESGGNARWWAGRFVLFVFGVWLNIDVSP